MPEVPNNVNMTIGNLGLSDEEENLIVTFMLTLTDGFTTPYRLFHPAHRRSAVSRLCPGRTLFHRAKCWTDDAREKQLEFCRK
jgi:hypothetical protein